MKKTSHTNTKNKPVAGLHREYRFDYEKAKPNRFAGARQPGAAAVEMQTDGDASATDAVLHGARGFLQMLGLRADGI
jgi:hypothetical protein